MTRQPHALGFDLFSGLAKPPEPADDQPAPAPPLDHAYDYWAGYHLPRAEQATGWQSPEDQHQALLLRLDAVTQCPCCGSPFARKEWADGSFVRGTNYRGPADPFRWRTDILSVKFECGLFLAVEENVCLSAHHPCLTATANAVQVLFDEAHPRPKETHA